MYLTSRESQEHIQAPQKLKAIVKLDMRILEATRVEDVNSKIYGTIYTASLQMKNKY